LWSRPGVSQQPPSTLDWTSGGWQFKNGNLNRRTPIEEPNQLQTGHWYVGFCTHAGSYSDGGNPWWCTRILMVADRLARPALVRDSESEPIFDALDGKTPTEAGQLLSQTPPDPQASPYMGMNAIDRYQVVARAREVTAAPKCSHAAFSAARCRSVIGLNQGRGWPRGGAGVRGSNREGSLRTEE
jgi:hypothetical protein